MPNSGSSNETVTSTAIGGGALAFLAGDGLLTEVPLVEGGAAAAASPAALAAAAFAVGGLVGQALYDYFNPDHARLFTFTKESDGAAGGWSLTNSCNRGSWIHVGYKAFWGTCSYAESKGSLMPSSCNQTFGQWSSCFQYTQLTQFRLVRQTTSGATRRDERWDRASGTPGVPYPGQMIPLAIPATGFVPFEFPTEVETAPDPNEERRRKGREHRRRRRQKPGWSPRRVPKRGTPRPKRVSPKREADPEVPPRRRRRLRIPPYDPGIRIGPGGNPGVEPDVVPTPWFWPPDEPGRDETVPPEVSPSIDIVIVPDVSTVPDVTDQPGTSVGGSPGGSGGGGSTGGGSVEVVPKRPVFPSSPRDRRVKEREGKGRSTGMAMWHFLDWVSERCETVDAVYMALPEKTRMRWERARGYHWALVKGKWKWLPPKNSGRHPLLEQAGQYGIDGCDWKLMALWHNWKLVDVKQALANVLANEFQDRIHGNAHKALKPVFGGKHQYWLDDAFKKMDKLQDAAFNQLRNNVGF